MIDAFVDELDLGELGFHGPLPRQWAARLGGPAEALQRQAEPSLPPIVSAQEWQSKLHELADQEKAVTAAHQALAARSAKNADDARREGLSLPRPQRRDELAGSFRWSTTVDSLSIFLRARRGGLADRGC